MSNSMQDPSVCPDCGGSGFIPKLYPRGHTEAKCDTCNGVGYFDLPADFNYGSQFKPDNCTECKHEWKTYDSGWTRYEYCSKCSEKKDSK